MGTINPAITVKNLSFAYAGSDILKDVNTTIEAGKLTFILGRNGSGKSTFLRLIAGLLAYNHGEIQILGKNHSLFSYSERSKLTGFLNQQHKAVFPFEVEEVVLTGRAGCINFLPKKSDEEMALEAMEKVGIAHLQSRIYSELSGGEQQLVMIARVMAQNPKILLLDEATSHLDFTNQMNLLTLLKKLVTDGLTVVAVLHDPNLAFVYGDDFLFVKDKQIIRSTPGFEPWDAGFLSTVYQSKLEAIPYNGRAILVPQIKAAKD